ncbi:MAG: hypothetical protein AUJ07_06835 [Crenarchaeota archaeon 13_1_40CM_3_53_5]|nr:MAG: hypothetical protein AUJ07_06835 [Crenarchaeota archaeon 13_1_40CM_3_53_5]
MAYLQAIALPVDVKVEVVARAYPIDCDGDGSSVELPEVAGQIEIDNEMVAEQIERINGRRARSRVPVDAERVGCSLPV